MSRFNKDTFEDFCLSRKPTQNVCNLNPNAKDLPVLEIDVISCRLNGILEANCDDIPVYSPLDEICKYDGKPGLHDYVWVDIQIPEDKLLQNYVYDGPRWYSKSECQVMLEWKICTYSDFKLVFDATTHRSANDLKEVLLKIQAIWQRVGKTQHAHVWNGCALKKKDTAASLKKKKTV